MLVFYVRCSYFIVASKFQLFKMTSKFIRGTAVHAGLMPSGAVPQNKRENLPRVCHALAFLGMTGCQDLFLVHLQGWKLGTRFQDGCCSPPQEDEGIVFLLKSFLSSPATFTYISLARLCYICKVA
ncbi:low quality protein: protein [Lynx pardinus]|uniref:Low quality protein: protein n=1 Tax=Lynx pardinus TaxID=191816 RepID=A0A485PDX7_LYNPA|nr:low quality protein: protein [Lynx pardinus]